MAPDLLRPADLARALDRGLLAVHVASDPLVHLAWHGAPLAAAVIHASPRDRLSAVLAVGAATTRLRFVSGR